MNVVTNNATDVTNTGVTLNGAVTDIGGEASVGVFFKYGTDAGLDPYTTTAKKVQSTVGVFNADINGLVTGIPYYFQACATTATGVVCGDIVSFVPG